MSKLQYNEEIHCPRCNAINKKSASICEGCQKKIMANYKPFRMFLKKHTKEELSSAITDKIFDSIKNFMLSHIYGIALSVTIIAAATSAVYSYEPYIEKLSEETAIAEGLIEAPAIENPIPEEPEKIEEPEEPADPELLEGGLPVNSEYFDLFSLNKSQVDARYGEGEFYREFATMYYDNGIGVSYGSHFIEDIDNSDRVYSLDLPLSMLFADCPNPVTEEDIRKTFAKVSSSYSEMDETTVLRIEYKGTYILLYPEYGMTPDTRAFTKKIEDY